MEKQRFSLLLLEPNEIYFDDYSVDLLLNLTENLKKGCHNRGKLKLCSKSLVFEPKDLQKPLIKIRFSEIESIFQGEKKGENNILFIRCSQYIEMLKNNVIAPYKFIRNNYLFAFSFYYAHIDDHLLQLSQQLHRASSLSILGQNDMITSIICSRHNRLKFDPLWLDSIYEKILYDCKVDEIHPLVTNPGRILLTDSFLYFQPYNNIQSGLEIKWEDDKSRHIYVSFHNSNEREEFLIILLKQSNSNIKSIESDVMTLKWQNRRISNYEYLIYLNSLADRSFDDLSQYPIFPWILTDYESKEIDLNNEKVYRDLSKPIGALNPQRLKRLKERCEEMNDSKYLYGSHYSTPGFVLFYLVRKYPHLMLCLQNGRFDHPDRMFNKVSDTFNNCLVNMSDFKELIPEFYDTEQEGDFLVNSKRINFGIRNNGNSVNNVELPPWANSSPRRFVEILRKALESDYVSANLHHWIDLIFGYKQRGEEAIKADNVFYPLCYEGSVNLDSVKDRASRNALEVQISEFGQIPKQLFNRPHISRTSSCLEIRNSIESNTDHATLFKTLELTASYIGHKKHITSLLIDNDVITSTGKDGVLKCFEISCRRQIRSVAISSLPLSSCQKIPNSNIYVIGSWDNTILLYNCNYGKITDVIPAHDDSVSDLHFLPDLGILISGSWDCSVKVWQGFTKNDHKTFRLSKSMIAYLPLEEKISCLLSKIDNNLIKIIIGTETGQVLIWNIQKSSNEENYVWNEQNEPQLLVKHDAEVTYLEFNYSQTKLASCSIDGSLIVTDISTGMTLFKKSLEFSITSLCWCNDLEYLLSADVDGCLYVWDLMQGQLKFKKNICNGPLSCVKYCKSHNIIITAGRDNGDYRISCWSIM